jgi:hypothetical protein
MSTPTTPRPPESLAVLFRDAAHLIAAAAEAGLPLLTGELEDLTGPVPRYCTLGALYEADPERGIVYSHLPTEAVLFLSGRVVSDVMDDDPAERIVDWNDQPQRTAAEVVAALLEAARDASPPNIDGRRAEQAHCLDEAGVTVAALAPVGGASR